ncbi:MAG: putative selenoprotein [Acidobacteriaceae bacterium]|nr:putative selenoprotein [Acidobacteriaceae bacterium]
MKILRQGWELLQGFLRELSDEGAYARYLQRSGRDHSGQEWRDFIDKRHGRKFKNAKCC